MSDAFDDFLERLEMPLPEPKTRRVIDVAIDAQASCMGLAVSCAQVALMAMAGSALSPVRLKK